MLLAILNTCSKEELAEDDLVLELENQKAITDGSSTPSTPSAASAPSTPAANAVSSPPPPPPEQTPEAKAEKEASMNRIRQKILAVGRISRVFAVLRQESESVSELKDLMGTTKLPYGSLALGAEGLRRAIHNFDDAKRSDIENERLPPTKEEKTKEEKDKINKAIEAAKHTPQKELEEIEAMKMDEVRRDSLALDSPRDV